MKLVKRFIPLLLVCAFLMSMPAAASTKASDQIVSYFIDVGPYGSGRIAIDFSITAAGYMKEVGVQEIYVYEITGSGLDEKAHYTTEDDKMIQTDSWWHSDTIMFYGTAGKTYYVTVTVYAKDYNNQSDSREKAFTVTAT